ncbi:MAG: hypothetical protein K6G03_05160 [Lachnospiraceae bacterium]|nr:hypothetical protein [Lachnospiraceae bacterium]
MGDYYDPHYDTNADGKLDVNEYTDMENDHYFDDIYFENEQRKGTYSGRGRNISSLEAFLLTIGSFLGVCAFFAITIGSEVPVPLVIITWIIVIVLISIKIHS